MRKFLVALAAVATISFVAPVTTSTSAYAQGWYGHRHGGWHGYHHRGWRGAYGYAPRVVVVPPRYGYGPRFHRGHHWGHHHRRGYYYGW